MFGICSSALINSITDNTGVHWDRVPIHFEFYVLIVLGIIVAALVRRASRADLDQQSWIRDKLDAIQAQGFPAGLSGSIIPPATKTQTSPSSVQERDVRLTEEAKQSLARQDDRHKRIILSFLDWLKSASLSEIVLNSNIRKVRSDSETDFIYRVGNIRVPIDLKLRDGHIVVLGIFEKD